MNGRSKALDDLIACLSGDVRDAHDWRTVAALASETLTVGSLADAVLSSPIAGRIPEEVRDLLLDVQSRARARNVRLKSQLLELTPALNSLGVEPILMRGVARLLSSPREESRLLSDIDLLVPGDRIKNCTNALRELGYELFRDPEDDRVPTVFYRTIDVGMVDLHAQLQPVYLRLDYDRLAGECRSIELPSGRALMPSPTCQMLCTIVHDQLHDGDYWRGLLDVRHFVDMHRIAGEGVDWRKLASFFPAGSPRNALFVQLRSARSLMQIDVPGEYSGGVWSTVQQLRRRIQVRLGFLQPLLTLLTIVLDPPPRSTPPAGRTETARETARRRFAHYFRPANAGKLLLK